MEMNPKLAPLIAEMAGKGWTRIAVGKALGLSEKSTYTRFVRGNFSWDEMERMVDILGIDDPGFVFFGVKGGKRA